MPLDIFSTFCGFLSEQPWQTIALRRLCKIMRKINASSDAANRELLLTFIIQGLECSQDDVSNLQNELRGGKKADVCL